MAKKLQLAIIDELQEVVITSDIAQTEEFTAKYELLATTIKKLNDLKKNLDDQLKGVLADQYIKSGDPHLSSETFGFTYVPGGTRETVDAQRLKAEEPEIYSRYVKVVDVSPSVRSNKKVKAINGGASNA